MNGKRKIITLIFIFLPGILFSQKKWSLEECIDYALKQNFEIESLRLNSKINKEQFELEKRKRLPSINAATDYNINYGKSVDPNTNDVTFNSFASNSYSLSGSIALFNGFIRKNKISYNKFIYYSGIAGEEAKQVDIAFKVMSFFYRSAYYNGFLQIAKEQKELSELNLKKVNKEVEIGLGAKTDILEIEARLADEELLVIQTFNNFNASVLELKKIMNFPVNEELVLENVNQIDYVDTPVYENADSIYSMAMKHLPALREKELQLKAVEKSLAIARGAIVPSISLSGGYYTGYYETRKDEFGNKISYKEQMKNNASQAIGVNLSIPIFYQGERRAEVKKTRLRLANKKNELQNFKKQLYYEIESYCQELTAITAEYVQTQKQTKSNIAAFEVADKKKEQGLINIVDFYTTKNLLSKAKGELLRTKLEYLMKRKTIDFYMGEPVFEINNMIK